MAKLNTENEQTKASGDMRSHNIRGHLLSFVERYERLQEEKDGLADDQKEVMSEAKSQGFDTKILRKVIQRRKMDAADRVELDAMLETYEDAIKEAEKDQTAQSEAEGT